MKAKLVREGSRWGTVYNDPKFQDKYYATFLVKFNEAEKWQTLTITTTKDYDAVLSYSIDGSTQLEDADSVWVNAILATANKGAYSACDPREFELIEKNGEFKYAMTKKCKDKMENELMEHMSYYPRGTLFAAPDQGPGPSFKDKASEQKSTALTPFN